MIATFHRNTIHSQDFTDPYLQKAKAICMEWLTGKQEFTLQTSGSTGKPKSIQVTSDQLKASVHATARALSLYEGTRALACLNIEYVAGFMMLIRAMELGWDLTVMPPTGNPLRDLPQNCEFDFTALVPMQLAGILTDEVTRNSVKKLGKILLGGVGLTPVQAELFSSLDQEIYHGYGMTETVSHVALRRVTGSSDPSNRYHLTGGVSCGTDERGCLYFEGEVTRHLRVQTNDLGTPDPSGRSFLLHGRIDNVVNSGGLKIQLEELENLLYQKFQEQGLSFNFYLWKRPDDRLGEALLLVVEGHPELKHHILPVLEKAVERRKQPKEIYFTESFLKTGSDKIDKARTFEQLKSQGR